MNRRHRVHVYALLAVASVILAWGFWRVAPHQFNGDEWSSIGWAIKLRFIDHLAPQFRKGGNLHVRLFAALLAPLTLYWHATGRWAAIGSGEQLYAAARTLEGPALAGVHDAALVGRALSVAAAIGTVYLLHRLGRTLHGHRAGLLSALALTGMAMFVTTAKLAFEDALHVALTVAVLYLAVRYLGTPDRWGWLATAAAFGLAVSAKASAGLLAPVLAVAAYRTATERRHLARLAATGTALAALAYVATTPAMLAHPDIWRYEMLGYVAPRLDALAGGPGASPAKTGPPGPLVAASYVVGTVGPVSALAVAVGLPAAVRYRHRIDPRAWTVAAYGALYAGWLLLPEIAQPSHIVPLHPVLALGVGLGAAALLDAQVDWRRRAGQATAALVVLSVLLTAVAVADFSTSRARATDWLATNVEPGASIDAYAYRAYRPALPAGATVREFGFESDLAEEPDRGSKATALSRVYAGCADYIVITSKYYSRFLDPRTTAPRVTAMYRDLVAGRTPYRVAARFGPPHVDTLDLRGTVWRWVTYDSLAGGANPTVFVFERGGEASRECSG